MQIAESYVSLNERASIRRTPYRDRINAFYWYWTRKEAYLKAWGRGLAIALSSFTVSPKIDQPQISVSDRGPLRSGIYGDRPDTGWVYISDYLGQRLHGNR